MLISLNWIKDFVDLPESENIHDLANKFTMTTAEVEEVKKVNAHLDIIKVVEITEIEKHPEADKLNLVTFNIGGSTARVVCGAPNVKAGLKVPYAAIGTVLPGGFKLEPKKIRGVLSEGMLCSETELGLGDGSSGLMELNSDATIGQSLKQYLNTSSDTLIDVDNKSLTHRPDLWGYYGLAREFSAIYKTPLKDNFNSQWAAGIESKFNDQAIPTKIKVDGNSSCLGFWGISLDNIKVQKSPQWMIDRLEAVGLRAINNIVDISNYVMMELGMPMHIYDRDQIKGDIQVGLAKDGNKFTTLDEVERTLVGTDTLISDDEKGLVLAGVMGGASSGVNEETKNIFIEVANWKAEEVRKTSTRLGLRTDSSTRFEKSLDLNLCYRSLLRAIDLVFEVCPDAKILGKPVYDGQKISETRNEIKTSVTYINKILGLKLSTEEIKEIFTSLDFEVSGDEQLLIKVPTYRATKDIQGQHDLAEEIGRVVGYDTIPIESPKLAVTPVRLTPYKEIERKVQDFMSLHAKSLEVLSYPLVGEKLLLKSSWPDLNEDLQLVNAISVEQDRMRPSLIPSFLEMTAVNAKNFSDFSFFEWGRSYLPKTDSFFVENNIVGLLNYSKSENKFVDTLNTTEKFLNFLGLNYKIQTHSKRPNPLVNEDWKGLHPDEFVDIVVRGKTLGAAFSVHPIVLRDFKIKGKVSILMLDLTDFCKKQTTKAHKYSPISKFPSSQFDCTVLVPVGSAADECLSVSKKLKNKDLLSLKIVQVFALNEEFNAVTLRFSFGNLSQTLEASVIKDYENQAVKELESIGFKLKT